MEQHFYRITEFCKAYGISRSTFYREVERGRLHPFKFDSSTLIPGWEAHRWNRNRCRPYLGKTGTEKLTFFQRIKLSISIYLRLLFRKRN